MEKKKEKDKEFEMFLVLVCFALVFLFDSACRMFFFRILLQ